jgi:hypothetical protein
VAYLALTSSLQKRGFEKVNSLNLVNTGLKRFERYVRRDDLWNDAGR